MHHQALAFKDEFLDGGGGHAKRALAAVFSEIGDMNKCRTLKANLNKGALHAWQYAYDLAQVDIADLPALNTALKVQFLHSTLGHKRHSGFKGRYVDQYVFSHADSLRGNT